MGVFYERVVLECVNIIQGISCNCDISCQYEPYFLYFIFLPKASKVSSNAFMRMVFIVFVT